MKLATAETANPGTRQDPERIACTIDAVLFGPNLTGIVETFKQRMRGAYAPSNYLTYHNLEEHIPTVWQYARTLCERCQAAGIDVNALVVEAAVWGHDSLYGLDHDLLGEETKEDVSGQYSYGLLIKLGAPEWFAAAVREAIVATHADEIPNTTEAKILRAADLRGVASDFEIFRANTERLFRERALTVGREQNYTDFVHSSGRFLAAYMAEFIALSPTATDEAGRSLWHLKGTRNLIRLTREALPPERKLFVVADLSLTANKLPRVETGYEDTEVITLHVGDKSILRYKASELSRENSGISSTNYFLPGSAGVAPIPDESVDRVHLYRPAVRELTEAARIVQKSGTICLDIPHLQSLEKVMHWASALGLHPVGMFRRRDGTDLILSKEAAAVVY